MLKFPDIVWLSRFGLDLPAYEMYMDLGLHVAY